MMTIRQYAEKRGISVATIYSWISRSQDQKNGFKAIRFGSTIMVEEIKPKIKS
jgi:hypothetical protein